MSDQELRDLVASLATMQQGAERIRQQTDDLRLEFDRIRKEDAQERREAHRQAQIEMRQLRKQLGEIGNKFGSFTEVMAWPSMQRMLQRRFTAEAVAAHVRLRRGDGGTRDVSCRRCGASRRTCSPVST